MSGATTDLQAPVLLVAMPQVIDPFFHQSVVLLLYHDDGEGSFGFIINRPTGIQLTEILAGMEIVWQGPPRAMAHFGGPVQPQLGSVLFAAEGELPEHASEVLPGLALTQHIGDLGRLAEGPPERLRLFLGYASWGEGQLTEEIVRNDWLIATVDSEVLFSPEPERVWGKVLSSLGIDPATLPSWTGDGGNAN